MHAGGRGKAGGVKLAKTPAEAKEIATKILGMQIKGLTVQKVLVTPAADIATEAYVGIILDRASKKPVFMVSPAGGIDIEEVAATTPEKILKLPIDTRYGLQPYQAMRARLLPVRRRRRRCAPPRRSCSSSITAFMKNGARSPRSTRSSTTPAGDVVALDAKMVIDDNELDRHPEHRGAARRERRRSRAKCMARNANLTFIKLDGNVGCVVNGAGLAMATMDLVKYYGGEPANFLDIGGSSNPEKVVNALKHHHGRPEREGDPVQHLRRHHAHR